MQTKYRLATWMNNHDANQVQIGYLAE